MYQSERRDKRLSRFWRRCEYHDFESRGRENQFVRERNPICTKKNQISTRKNQIQHMGLNRLKEKECKIE